jgi:hypothetical protein
MSSCAVAILLMEMKCISKLDAGIMQMKCTVRSERQVTQPVSPTIENPALING